MPTSDKNLFPDIRFITNRWVVYILSGQEVKKFVFYVPYGGLEFTGGISFLPESEYKENNNWFNNFTGGMLESC